jgi:hypothetical protein
MSVSCSIHSEVDRLTSGRVSGAVVLRKSPNNEPTDQRLRPTPAIGFGVVNVSNGSYADNSGDLRSYLRLANRQPLLSGPST